MNKESNPPQEGFSLTYRSLSILFIAGFTIQAVLWFVPAAKVTVGGLIGQGGQELSLSNLDAVRLLIQSGQVGLGILFVTFFCITVAFVALAMKYPRRWVFIAGSCFEFFGMVLNFFSGSNPNVQHYLLPQLLGYVAAAMVLTGLWIKPPILGIPSVHL